ncbi:MAG: hypothetical protein K2O69_06685 [Odoribacter sp.]|nr:hypothetical protein [Odoribacter sp.]
MTTLELSAELARQIDIISDDEDCLRRALKYIKKLAAQKQQADDSLMTKEEFFAKIDRSLQQAKEGKVYEMLPGESLDAFIKRVECTR